MKIDLNDVLLALKYLFPNSAPPEYHLFQKDGETRITSWNISNAIQPTELEIEQALVLAKEYQDKLKSALLVINQIEALSGFSRTQIEFLLSVSTDLALKTRLSEHETSIQAQRDLLVKRAQQ